MAWSRLQNKKTLLLILERGTTAVSVFFFSICFLSLSHARPHSFTVTEHARFPSPLVCSHALLGAMSDGAAAGDPPAAAAAAPAATMTAVAGAASAGPSAPAAAERAAPRASHDAGTRKGKAPAGADAVYKQSFAAGRVSQLCFFNDGAADPPRPAIENVLTPSLRFFAPPPPPPPQKKKPLAGAGRRRGRRERRRGRLKLVENVVKEGRFFRRRFFFLLRPPLPLDVLLPFDLLVLALSLSFA